MWSGPFFDIITFFWNKSNLKSQNSFSSNLDDHRFTLQMVFCDFLKSLRNYFSEQFYNASYLHFIVSLLRYWVYISRMYYFHHYFCLILTYFEILKETNFELLFHNSKYLGIFNRKIIVTCLFPFIWSCLKMFGCLSHV